MVTQTRVVIVRHVSERSRASNTGHILARAIPGCEMVDHGVAGEEVRFADALDDSARVLFPGSEASDDLSGIRSIVVLDGSWSQVRKMRWRIPAIAAIRPLSLPPSPGAAMRLRRAPEPGHLATMEAVAAALRLLGDATAADELDACFLVMAQRMRALRGFDMPEKIRSR